MARDGGLAPISIPFFINGAGALTGGIAMIVVGAKRVPVVQAHASDWMRPRVSVGPTGSSLSWSF